MSQEGIYDCNAARYQTGFLDKQSLLPNGSMNSNNTTKARKDLRRQIKGSLNRLTADSFPVIAEKCAKIVEEASPQEVEVLIDQIINTAMADGERPEIFADLILLLKYRCPYSSSSTSTGIGHGDLQKLITQKLESEFNKLPDSMREPVVGRSFLDSEEESVAKRNRNIVGLFVQTAHLFVRRLISLRLLQTIISDQIYGSESRPLAADEPPEEGFVKCLRALLMIAGTAVENSEGGPPFLDQVTTRLQEVKARCHGRLLWMINDIIEGREHGWQNVGGEGSRRRFVVVEKNGSVCREQDIRKCMVVNRQYCVAEYSPAYAEYMAIQEQKWNARAQGIFIDFPLNFDREIVVSFDDPVIRQSFRYHSDDPPNAPSVDLPTSDKSGSMSSAISFPGPSAGPSGNISGGDGPNQSRLLDTRFMFADTPRGDTSSSSEGERRRLPRPATPLHRPCSFDSQEDEEEILSPSSSDDQDGSLHETIFIQPTRRYEPSSQ